MTTITLQDALTSRLVEPAGVSGATVAYQGGPGYALVNTGRQYNATYDISETQFQVLSDSIELTVSPAGRGTVSGQLGLSPGFYTYQEFYDHVRSVLSSMIYYHATSGRCIQDYRLIDFSIIRSGSSLGFSVKVQADGSTENGNYCGTNYWGNWYDVSFPSLIACRDVTSAEYLVDYITPDDDDIYQLATRAITKVFNRNSGWSISIETTPIDAYVDCSEPVLRAPVFDTPQYPLDKSFKLAIQQTKMNLARMFLRDVSEYAAKSTLDADGDAVYCDSLDAGIDHDTQLDLGGGEYITPDDIAADPAMMSDLAVAVDQQQMQEAADLAYAYGGFDAADRVLQQCVDEQMIHLNNITVDESVRSNGALAYQQMANDIRANMAASWPIVTLSGYKVGDGSDMLERLASALNVRVCHNAPLADAPTSTGCYNAAGMLVLNQGAHITSQSPDAEVFYDGIGCEVLSTPIIDVITRYVNAREFDCTEYYSITPHLIAAIEQLDTDVYRLRIYIRGNGARDDHQFALMIQQGCSEFAQFVSHTQGYTATWNIQWEQNESAWLAAFAGAAVTALEAFGLSASALIPYSPATNGSPGSHIAVPDSSMESRSFAAYRASVAETRTYSPGGAVLQESRTVNIDMINGSATVSVDRTEGAETAKSRTGQSRMTRYGRPLALAGAVGGASMCMAYLAAMSSSSSIANMNYNIAGTDIAAGWSCTFQTGQHAAFPVGLPAVANMLVETFVSLGRPEDPGHWYNGDQPAGVIKPCLLIDGMMSFSYHVRPTSDVTSSASLVATVATTMVGTAFIRYLKKYRSYQIARNPIVTPGQIVAAPVLAAYAAVAPKQPTYPQVERIVRDYVGEGSALAASVAAVGATADGIDASVQNVESDTSKIDDVIVKLNNILSSLQDSHFWPRP